MRPLLPIDAQLEGRRPVDVLVIPYMAELHALLLLLGADLIVEVQVGREVAKHIVHFSLVVDVPVGRFPGQAAVPGSVVVAARVGTGTLADISTYSINITKYKIVHEYSRISLTSTI